jgi:hypothetical protein
MDLREKSRPGVRRGGSSVQRRAMKGTGQSVSFYDHAEWKPRGMADAGIDGSRRGRSLEGNEAAATRPGLLHGACSVGLGPRKAPSPPPVGHKETENGSRTLAEVSRWSFLVAGGAGACKLLQDHTETVKRLVTGQLGFASQIFRLAPERWDAGTVIVLGMIAILAASVARDSRCVINLAHFLLTIWKNRVVPQRYTCKAFQTVG